MKKIKNRLGDGKGFKSVLTSNVLLFSFFVALIFVIDAMEKFSSVSKFIASIVLLLFFIFLSYLIGKKIDKGVKAKSRG